MPIGRHNLRDTPVTVVDFETTGLSPKTGARVIEVAAVRIEPGGVPTVVLDTLADPEGPVFASEIHGIYDDDVIGAPRFADLRGDLAHTLRDGPVLAFNASFDLGFLNAEYRRCLNTDLVDLPYLCLMYLRPLLGLGKRCSLAVACETLGIDAPSHRAADDALSAAHLWIAYRDAAINAGISTFEQLRNAGKYKFLSSFDNQPFADPFDRFGRRPCNIALKPRTAPLSFEPPIDTPELVATISAARPKPLRKKPITTRRRQYWQALQASLTDGLIDGSELRDLKAQQHSFSLEREDIQAVHTCRGRTHDAHRRRPQSHTAGVGPAKESLLGPSRVGLGSWRHSESIGIATGCITVVAVDERSDECSLRSLLFDSLATELGR